MRKFTLFIAALCAVSAMATEGALSGKFSISDSEKVCFSQGNLQYQASTSTWRFAEHQYDIIGAANANISDTYDGWIDLFGWGTGNNPTKHTTDNNDYSVFTDWGVNRISNGGDAENLWRTMTRDEWYHLANRRTNAANLKGQANVCGQNGIILLPDDWTLPDGQSFTPMPNNWTTNVYDATAWAAMQSAGAVFLPYNMFRDGTSVAYSEWNYSSYWTSTVSDNTGFAWDADFKENEIDFWDSMYKSTGTGVRLVQAAEPTHAVSVTVEFPKAGDAVLSSNAHIYDASNPDDNVASFTLPEGAHYYVLMYDFFKADQYFSETSLLPNTQYQMRITVMCALGYPFADDREISANEAAPNHLNNEQTNRLDFEVWFTTGNIEISSINLTVVFPKAGENREQLVATPATGSHCTFVEGYIYNTDNSYPFGSTALEENTNYSGQIKLAADTDCEFKSNVAITANSNPVNGILENTGQELICYVIFNSGTATAIGNTSVDATAVKEIHDGQLLIKKNGKIYNAQGAEMK